MAKQDPKDYINKPVTEQVRKEVNEFADQLVQAPANVQAEVFPSMLHAKDVKGKLKFIRSSANNRKPIKYRFSDWAHRKLISLLPDFIASAYVSHLHKKQIRRIVKIIKYLSDLSTSNMVPEDIASAINMSSAFINEALVLCANKEHVLVFDYEIKATSGPVIDAVVDRYETLKAQNETRDTGQTQQDHCPCPVCVARRELFGAFDPEAMFGGDTQNKPKKPKLH